MKFHSHNIRGKLRCYGQSKRIFMVKQTSDSQITLKQERNRVNSKSGRGLFTSAIVARRSSAHHGLTARLWMQLRRASWAGITRTSQIEKYEATYPNHYQNKQLHPNHYHISKYQNKQPHIQTMSSLSFPMIPNVLTQLSYMTHHNKKGKIAHSGNVAVIMCTPFLYNVVSTWPQREIYLCYCWYCNPSPMSSQWLQICLMLAGFFLL